MTDTAVPSTKNRTKRRGTPLFWFRNTSMNKTGLISYLDIISRKLLEIINSYSSFFQLSNIRTLSRKQNLGKMFWSEKYMVKWLQDIGYKKIFREKFSRCLTSCSTQACTIWLTELAQNFFSEFISLEIIEMCNTFKKKSEKWIKNTSADSKKWVIFFTSKIFWANEKE